MIVKPGWYMTRGGHKALVDRITQGAIYPVMGTINGGIHEWFTNGRCYVHMDSPYDLVSELPVTLQDVLPALKEGKRIRRRSWSPDRSLPQEDNFLCLAVADATAADWEIINEEPAKYTVEMWVSRKPYSHPSERLLPCLLGEGNTWDRRKTQNCTRKIRVTVEEEE